MPTLVGDEDWVRRIAVRDVQAQPPHPPLQPQGFFLPSQILHRGKATEDPCVEEISLLALSFQDGDGMGEDPFEGQLPLTAMISTSKGRQSPG